MIDIKKINIKRKHKIAAVVILAVLSLMLILNSVMAKKPVLSVSSNVKNKKVVKSNKPAGKKTKIVDANQVSDSNLIAGATNAAKKSVKSGKSANKKTKVAEDRKSVV